MTEIPLPDLDSRSYRRSRLVGVLLTSSLVLNLLALLLPFVVIDAAGSNPWIYGLFGSVQMLLDSKMVVLACMVLVFSVIFPFAKLITLAWLWWHGVSTPKRHALLSWVEKLGKWSLFDVFLVAIMVGLTNNQWLISSASLPGLSCFLVAVVLGMLAGEVLTAVTGHPPVMRSTITPRSGLLLSLLLLIGGLLAATLVVPFIQIDDWRLSNRAYSLLTLIPALWQNGSPILATGLGAFLIVMPMVSWLLIAVLVVGWWHRQPPTGYVRLVELCGRWSMLSVFALSLGVFIAEGHRFLGTQPLPGVWALVVGLGLTQIGHLFLGRSLGR